MNILIVDDDADIRKFLMTLIRKTFRCNVDEAENGQIALDKLSDVNPDIICMDVTMPVMDGITFVEKIKKLDKFSDTPIIMMSAISEKSTISKLLSLGITNYILKPFSFQETQTRLRDIIFPILKEKKDSLTFKKK